MNYRITTIPPPWGGTGYQAHTDYSFIGSGTQNIVGSAAVGSCPASYGFIGGGTQNCIDVSPTQSTCFGFIGGGSSNVICAGATHSSILGGDSNTVNAACATVIGGSGNTVTHNYAAVFGNGISSVAAGTLHLSNLWLEPGGYNTFVGIAPTGTFPLGTIYVDTTIGLGAPLRVQI